MAAFLKCTDSGGAEIFVNFDYVYQIKRRGPEPGDNRALTELMLANPLGSILVRDPPDSLDRQLRDYTRGS